MFLDADVLIAGSASTTGASYLILRLAELGAIKGLSSDQVRAECERNLAKKLPEALPLFRAIADVAVDWLDDPTEEGRRRLRGQGHPKDLPILAAALAAGCETIITFNVRDFRPKGNLIRVERPAEFLERLRDELSTIAD